MQTSEVEIKLVGTPIYKTKNEHWTKKAGTIHMITYVTSVKAQFQLVEKREKPKIKIPKIAKKVIAKKKTSKKPKYNFQISLKCKDYKSFQKYVFLIPDEVFSEKRFERKDFENNRKYYKKVKKYLYKIKNGKFLKNIKSGKYQLSFLIFDGDFFSKENSFKTLEFHKSFKKTYNISKQNFSFW